MRLPSYRRTTAVMLKELIQMRRDRLTFGMMIAIPVLQLLLFGYAINTDPKNLPAAAHVIEDSAYARSVLAAISNTGYIRFTGEVKSETEVDRLLSQGDVAFVVTIPEGFARAVDRGEPAPLLIDADATDPSAAANAISAVSQLGQTALRHDFRERDAASPALDLVIHRRYNPEGLSSYNIVPGLLGVILTMTMVLITALAVTRETERGTMENLLAMPLSPGEVMLGKITPYIAIGYVQVVLVLAAARYLFGVPMLGSLELLFGVLAVFIAANLAVGFTFSTIARNQLQAMQMAFFFFLPSILLSGFMFPFRGMPQWAQWIGEALPLTHFLRAVRAILLKGSPAPDIWPHVWPLLIFLAVVTLIALRRYRQTLD